MNNQDKHLKSPIDLAHYPETCDNCRMPARSEQVSDERIGVEQFQFCINPKCINFDGMYLKQKRDHLERTIRSSKGFRRHRERLWKQEIRLNRLAMRG